MPLNSLVLIGCKLRRRNDKYTKQNDHNNQFNQTKAFLIRFGTNRIQ